MSDHDLHPRAAKYRLRRIEDILSQLEMARRSLSALGIPHAELDTLFDSCKLEHVSLLAQTREKIEPRNRPKQRTWEGEPRRDYLLFLDECGSHVPGAADGNFPVFCLCGVVIARSAFEEVDCRWKEWKRRALGSEDVRLHEPDVRHMTGKFRGATLEHSINIQLSMAELLCDLDFTCIATVVDLRAFNREFPDHVVDDFLPRSSYLMSIDFLLERFLHLLQVKGDHAHGLVTAESRGAKEDALVHSEFIRLHLEGTQFVADSAFRYHLRPYIEFLRKSRNSTGLQIADLAARPFAEKVLSPQNSPVRWDVFAPKLYDGGQGAPHKYGLKVFPLTEDNDPFSDIRDKQTGH